MAISGYPWYTYFMEVGGRAAPGSEPIRRWCHMSTYEELQLIVSVAMLIVAILNFTHKK